MQSKGKLRRLNCEQLMDLATAQKDPVTLINCAQIIRDRNNTLQAKRDELVDQLLGGRESIEKTVVELKVLFTLSRTP